MKEQKFKGLSIEKCWIPLTATFIETNNMLQKLTNNDNDYCLGMKYILELIKPLYKNLIDDETLERFTWVFIYVLEFKYGNPYKKNTGSEKINKYISVYDYFDMIKKNWNTDISAELIKAKKIIDAN